MNRVTQDSSIITFPAAVTAQKATPPSPPGCATMSVIDLQSRRDAASAKAEAGATHQSESVLSPGEVWDALSNDRIVLHYQPQFDMQTGQMIAAEALVRLVGVDGQLIYPDRFIEFVEESDLIVALGRASIEQVCANLSACRAADYPLQRVAINLSARQLNVDTNLLPFIDHMLAVHGLSHADLEFELTERQRLTPQCEGLAVLNALAERGARIVIDDFGIGYSSIVYLAELPVSAFKLDRSLVDGLPENTAMQALVEGLLTLAERLDLEVIAEGIETDRQDEYLVQAGCRIAQGYAYARPMGIDDLQAFMTDASTRQDASLRF